MASRTRHRIPSLGPSLRLDDEDDDDRDDDDGAAAGRRHGVQMAERLFKARKVLVFGTIDDRLARDVTAQFLALAAAGDEPVRMFVNSPGGHVESGDTIHDMMNFIAPRVLAIGTGWVASAGALIFLGAPREDRYCLPNTRFLLHQPSGGVRGPATDIDIEANEIIKMRARINRTIAAETGQSFEKVEADTDRNFWMSAEEARDYGVVGHIVKTADEIG